MLIVATKLYKLPKETPNNYFQTIVKNMLTGSVIITKCKMYNDLLSARVDIKLYAS